MRINIYIHKHIHNQYNISTTIYIISNITYTTNRKEDLNLDHQLISSLKNQFLYHIPIMIS